MSNWNPANAASLVIEISNWASSPGFNFISAPENVTVAFPVNANSRSVKIILIFFIFVSEC